MITAQAGKGAGLTVRLSEAINPVEGARRKKKAKGLVR